MMATLTAMAEKWSTFENTTININKDNVTIDDNMLTRVNERTQIDIIDMQQDETKKFRFFFVYEEQFSKYVILQALENDSVIEVAEKLIDIFAMIGAPQIIQSSNGQNYAQDLVKEIRTRIPILNIASGSLMKHNQINRDFRSLITSWKKDNPTRLWYEGLKYVQIIENMTLKVHSTKIPAEFILGREILQDVARIIKTDEIVNDVWPEKDLMTESKTTTKYNCSNLQENLNDDFQDSQKLNNNLAKNENGSDLNLIEIKDELPFSSNETDQIKSNIEHPEEKPSSPKRDFQCKMCNKQYLKLNHLNNHMKIHKKSKSFECTICAKSFRWISRYEKHMQLNHSEEKTPPAITASEKDKNRTVTTEKEPVQLTKDDSKHKIKSENDSKKTKNRGLPPLRKKGKASVKFNGNPSLECTYCNQKFNFPSVLQRHMRTHTNERPYICQVCGKSFKQLGHLSQHALTHTDYRSFQCSVCEIKFESLDALKTHSLTHKDSNGTSRCKDIYRLFECDICKKVFPTKSVLERHIFTHTHERQFGCKICGNRFKQASHLKSHMLVHTGERKFECLICSKRFSLSNSLKKHMYVHNGNKPFQCDVCGARFLERRNLNGHLMTHTNERPFACKICGKRYTLADTLKRHVSAAHENGRTYQCEICAKMFKQLAHLSVHKKVHMDERPFQCHLCEKNFKHKNVLKSHLAIHANVRPFECDVCNATFVRKTNLQTHITSAHMNERPHSCNICHKRFKQISHLNGHIIIHSNSLPYQCDFCDRRCNRLDNLKKHMKLHTKNEEQIFK